MAAAAALAVSCGVQSPSTRDNPVQPRPDGGASIVVGSAGGPDTDGDGLSDSQEAALGTDPSTPDSDGDGYTDKQEVDFGSNPTDPASIPQGCAEVTATTQLVRKPVDIIIAVDGSSSMQAEIKGIEQFINSSFAQKLTDLDYRVILIAFYGNSDVKTLGGAGKTIPTLASDGSVWKFEDFFGMCIGSPLGANTCAKSSSDTFGQYPLANATSQPGNGADGAPDMTEAFPKNATRFYHISEAVDSNNMIAVLKHTYSAPDRFGLAQSGWGGLLREGAIPFFIVFTDDNIIDAGLKGMHFDTWLTQTDKHGKFGTASARTYIFNSVIGVPAKSSPADPYLPSEAVQYGKCAGAEDVDTETYQQLSIATQGLRFSVCADGNSNLYDALLTNLAAQVVDRALTPCEYTLSAPPAGKQYNFDGVILRYTPSSGAAFQDVSVVATEQACATAGGFYVTDNVIKLCPTTCSTVQADSAADIDVLVSCVNGVI
jgi:hypothetical protein